jgi:hypothetical protein
MSRETLLAEAAVLARHAFVTVCADCGKHLAIRHDLRPALSHGICDECAEKVLHPSLAPLGATELTTLQKWADGPMADSCDGYRVTMAEALADHDRDCRCPDCEAEREQVRGDRLCDERRGV